MGVESWSGVRGSWVEGGAGESPASTRVLSARGLSARGLSAQGLSAQGLSTQGLRAEVLPWLMAVADPGECWWERLRRWRQPLEDLSELLVKGRLLRLGTLQAKWVVRGSRLGLGRVLPVAQGDI